MKITDIPTTGTFEPNRFDRYEWTHIPGYPNGLRVNKAAECENPEYEADIYFPGGVVNFDDMSGCTIEMGWRDIDGGGNDLDDNWCEDIFYPLFDHLKKEYQVNTIII